MHSFTRNQLTDERFSSLIKYDWYSCDHISKDSGHFKNVYDVFLSFDNDLRSMAVCSDFPFICCSHCHRILTFLVDNHKH